MNPAPRSEHTPAPPQRPELEPLRTDDTKAILAGMALWAVALVVLLVAPPAGAAAWWPWTCVAGLVGGVFGLWYIRRRDRVAPTIPPDEQPIEPSTAVPPASG
ncbi:DUF2530 domain-containing protein [Spongiactinospora gelatinilytica]|uniref:DUF2530 domain-containing protein n=1 Tax=Spongiactinospora gelatinilytica TaxID=2666298 RepID=UPI001F1CFD8E|nr:DUF2530 domain-containing protein [Spongiactinospora gelatinilytica]